MAEKEKSAKVNTENKRRLFYCVILCIILFVQLLNLIHWKNEKSSFFVDEYYTMENVGAYNSSKGQNYVYRSDDWQASDWMDADILQDKFRFDPSKSLFNCSFADNASRLLKKNNYFALVNAACSLCGGISSISDVALFLNFVLFAIQQFVLFVLGYKISKDCFTSALLCVFNGFAGITIGLAEYVRMYTWLGLLFAIILLLHCCIWEEERIPLQILYEALLGIVLFFSYKVQQLTVVYMAIMCILISAGLLLTHRTKKAAAYFFPVLAGGVFGGIKLGIFRRIAGAGDDSVGHLGNFYDALFGPQTDYRMKLVRHWYEVMWHQVFGARTCMLFFVAVIVGLVLWKIIKREKPDENEIFIYILTLSALLYFAFTLIVKLDRTRYILFSFIILMIVTSFCAGKVVVLFRQKSKAAAYICMAVVAAAALYGAFKTYRVGDIENIYSEDRRQLEALHEGYADWDNLVYHDTDNNGDGHLYDSLYNAGSGTEFRYITQENYKDFDAEGREHFMLWTHRGGEVKCEDVLHDQGYDIELLAQTHISDIYACIKKR